MSRYITPKKSLGQHFLIDENIAKQIVSFLSGNERFTDILEVGPGMGVLTKYLLNRQSQNLFVIEKDREACEYLKENFTIKNDKIIQGDVLNYDLNQIFSGKFAVIGNFPYNISTQILFKVLEFRDRVPEVVGMFQKEVAARIASKPDNRTYGILSVLLQSYYDIEYLITVDETVFEPPPKVKSGVIRLKRNNTEYLDCDEKLFFTIVKTAFNQRRKMLGNALKPLGRPLETIDESILKKRAENLSVEDFVKITQLLSVIS